MFIGYVKPVFLLKDDSVAGLEADLKVLCVWMECTVQVSLDDYRGIRGKQNPKLSKTKYKTTHM